VGQRIFKIITASFAALLLACATQLHADAETKPLPHVPWKKVPAAEKKILGPLQNDWDQLQSVQQRKMIGAAKTYPKLAPIQQERFQERIKDWAELTPAQRHAARDKYKNLSSLPPEKQHILRERWNQKSAQATASGSTTAPPSVSDSTSPAR
jgi:hypothetical protein